MLHIRPFIRPTIEYAVRQKYTIAAMLFNLYSVLIAGVSFWYSLGRKLVEDHTTKSQLLQPCLTEPNDAVVYALSRDGLEVASSFVYVARGWGLTVSPRIR